MAEGKEALAVLARPGRRKAGRRVLRFFVATFLLLSLGMAGLLGFAYWHFQGNENSAFLRDRVLAAIGEAAGPTATIALDRAQLGFDGSEPVFSLSGLAVRDPGAGLSVEIGHLDLGLTPGSFVRLTPDPTRLTLKNLQIVLPVHQEGRDAVILIQQALGSIAGLTRMIANVPNLISVEAPDIAITRRNPDGSQSQVGEVLALQIRREGEHIRLELDRSRPTDARAGRASPLGLNLVLIPDETGRKALAIRSEGNAVAALLALVGYPLAVIDPNLKFDAELDAGISEGQKAGPVMARISLGGGVLDLTPYGIPPLVLDEVSLSLSGEAGSTEIGIPRFVFRSLETQVVANGMLHIEGQIKRLQLRAQNVIAKPLKPGGAPISFEDVRLEASLARDFSALTIDRLVVRDGGGEAQAMARFSRQDGGVVETHVSGRDMDLMKAIRLWPVFVSPNLRTWLVERAKTGRVVSVDVRTRLAGQALRDAWDEKPVPQESVAAEYQLDGVTLAALNDAPDIRGARLSGQSTGKQTNLRIEAGTIEAPGGKPVSLAGAQFSVADLHRRPLSLDMRIPISGRLDAVAAVLSQPGFRLGTRIPPEIARGEGQVEGEILAQLRLVRNPAPSDLKIEAKGDIRSVVIPAIVPNERLEAGQFQLLYRANAFQLKGEARLNGLAAQIEWRSDGDKPSIATIRATLDDAQRQKRGIDLRPMVTGPVTAVVSATFEKNKPPEIDVEVDLAPARVEGLPPGFTKRAGQTAKASFGYEQKGERLQLADFALDLGPVALRGKLELGKDGSFQKGEFEQFRLSPGDNARATIEKQRNTTRIGVRGNSFDLRPFLRGLQSGKIDDAKAPDVDLDIQTTVLVGFSGELISSGEIQAQRRGGLLARLAVKGQFGPSSLLVETAEGQERDSTLLRISTSDGGALLRFLDIYSKAYGGRLSADIRTRRDGQSGLVQMRDFMVRGEPLLGRYAGASSPSGAPSQAQGQPSVGRDSVPFTKMRADFLRRPGRIDVREAVMWGPQVGGSLEGVLDYGQDRVDLKGALVPAYALNNLFAQVPILGPIFGGSQYEGLFALPFVIQGRASAPVLRTNALSVIAPGFLRKLFEVQREGEAVR